MLNQGKDDESTSLVQVEKMVKPFETYHSAVDKKIARKSSSRGLAP
jgi:hypothetical protein